MIRIIAPHFTAGVIITAGRAGRRAPKLYYMVGWTAQEIIEYCLRKGWRYELLP